MIDVYKRQPYKAADETYYKILVPEKNSKGKGVRKGYLWVCLLYTSYIATSLNAKVRAYMQSQFLLLPAIQTIHKITNARTGYHRHQRVNLL